MGIALSNHKHTATKTRARLRRQVRGRKKIQGTAERPRLVVTRSSKHISVQVVDDLVGKTLASASTMEADVRATTGDKTAKAKKVGELVAERAKAAGVEEVVFDRGGNRYAGRVAAIADGEFALNPMVMHLLFGGFMFAFAIKAPLWPLHRWLPDSAVQATPASAVLMMAIMDKVGTFGMIRYCLPLFGDSAALFAPVIITLSVIGIIYGAVVAIGQTDVMRLIAYTSISHFGFIILGIFVGPLQSASRSHLARIAPPHLQTQMFGLFAFSGKATAFAGPLLVGWVTAVTDSQRWGMSTILVFLVIGFLLMLTIPASETRESEAAG